jgi:glycosyltransferase involved in cell wall biosynthesis
MWNKQMIPEPNQNNSNDPLISILIYDYDGQYLRQCLDSIFHQHILPNFEVILIDDATKDGSWDTALEFLNQYPNRITVNRNRRVLGPEINLRHAAKMAKGRYCAMLTQDRAFLPEYIKNCIQKMIFDPHERSEIVRRSEDLYAPVPLRLPSILGSSLVSILCYNYNYGRYLRQCLESIFAQTYENIELCFSDNASTDESWGIALEFARKYPGKMHITRNRKNFGVDDNFANCRRNMQGKYYINFCSDDVLYPEYVERCVSVLEMHPNAGLALVNRAIIDEHGGRHEEPPFYNQSCIIPGEEQAAVYMMAGINPSVSQIMYRQAIVDSRTATGGLVTRYYGTRFLDFNVSIDFDIAYLKEPLLMHRLHGQSDTNQADTSLLPVIGMYVLNHQFADIASVRNLTKVTDRLPQSVEKLARLAIRYSVRSLLVKDEHTARRYFYLAMAMHPRIADDPTWKQLQEYWTGEPALKANSLEQLRTSDNLTARSISYDPPPRSIPIFPMRAKSVSAKWHRSPPLEEGQLNR